MAPSIKTVQVRALNGGVPGDKLIVESKAAGSSAFKSVLYSYTSRLIRLRYIPILAIRTINLHLMVRS